MSFENDSHIVTTPPTGPPARDPETPMTPKREPTRPAPGRSPRDPGREVLEGLLGGFAVALLVCVFAFASTSWLAA